MKSTEVQLNESLAKITVLETENGQLKEAITNGKKATAKAERDAQLKESKLPEPSVKRISESFANSADNAGLKEAINTENEYVKSLRTIVKHNGTEQGTEVKESDVQAAAFRERQFKAYVASGLSEANASAMSGHKK